MLKFAILFSSLIAATSAIAQPSPGIRPVDAEVVKLREQNLALREEMGRLQLAMLISETLARDEGKLARATAKSNVQRVASRR